MSRWLFGIEAAKDAAEEAEGAALVGGGEVEAAQQEAEVMLVGSLHVRGRVAGGEHDLLDEIGERVEVPGGGAGCGFGRRIGSFRGDAAADGELVEADSGRLAKVHGGLAGIGGDFHEVMAEGEIFAGEAVFFGSEEDGDLSGVIEFAGDDGGELVEGDDGLLGFAVGEGAGSDDECGVAEGFGQGGGLAGVDEEFRSADGGAGLAPVRLVGGDDGEMSEAEVGHGASDGANVEGIAGRDEDDGDAVALGRREQEMIVDSGDKGRQP